MRKANCITISFAFFLTTTLAAQKLEMTVIDSKEEFIIANKGSDHGITENSTYQIIRKTSLGEKIIGMAKVRLIKEKRCGLKVTQIDEKFKIQKGDILREDYSDMYSDMETIKKDVSTDKRRESWYTYWGLGISSITYPADIQAMLNYIKAQYGPSNYTLSLDLLGFYFHISPKTLAGFIINGVGDRYDYSTGYFFQINQYIYGLSFIRFLNRHFGNGLFLRSDIGLAKYVYQSNIDGNYVSDNGVGGILGGGYSVDLGGTRILFNLNYGYRRIQQKESGILSFSLGGLF